jgi:hypothetical protein
LRITQLSSGGQIVSWQSVPGKNYQVYATPAVTQAMETVSPLITAYGTSMSFTNLSSGYQRFYRVAVLP